MKKILILFFIFLALTLILPKSASQAVQGFIQKTSSSTLKPLSQIGQKIRYPFVWITEINQVRQENVELKSRVAKLSKQIIELESLKKENAALRAELKLRPETSGFQRLIASVISLRLPGDRQSLIINRGKLSGIKKGDAVVSGEYLVGKIGETYTNSAEVILITSFNSLIQAKIAETGEKGIVRGDLSGIYLTELPGNTEIKDKAIVETSGLGGNIPAGILIGETTKDVSVKQQASKKVRLRSYVDFNSLDVVFVLTQTGRQK